MNKTAIVIDDDEISILLMSNALELNNFNVVSSSNGNEACDLYLNHQAQVIICDIFMPEMDGFETIKAIRKINNDVLVVAITSYDESYMAAAKKFGANLAFHKSVSPQCIVDEVLEKLSLIKVGELI